MITSFFSLLFIYCGTQNINENAKQKLRPWEDTQGKKITSIQGNPSEPDGICSPWVVYYITSQIFAVFSRQ